MRLQPTFRLALSLALACLLFVFFAIATYHSYRSTRQASYRLCCQILDTVAAVRGYVGQTLRPAVEEVVDGKEVFIPEAMSGSFAARQYLERLRTTRPGLYYKFASPRPRRPENQPNTKELELLDYFRQRPDANQWQGVVALGAGGDRYLLVARPMRFTFDCLRCHGDAADAPAALRAAYGDRGYGFKEGDVALQVVALPLALGGDPWSLTLGFFLPAAVLVFLLYLSSLRLFNLYVAEPVRRLATAMDGVGEVPGREPDLRPLEGSLEFFDLGRRFQAMAQRLVEREQQQARLFRALEAAKHQWEATFDAIPDAVGLLGKDYRIQRCNRALADRLERRPADLVGRPCHLVLEGESEPPAGCPHQLAMASGRPQERSRSHPVTGGHLLESFTPVLDEAGNVTTVVYVGRDITARIQLEEERRRAQVREEKQRAILTLAGGIAHDFNNALTAVMGNTELLAARLADDATGRQCLAVINQAARQMADQTRQLLAYARAGRYQTAVVPVTVLVDEAVSKARLRYPAGGAIRVQVTAGSPWPVEVDREQMLQALVNVLANGLEAVAEQADGWLEVTLANEHRPAWECEHHHHHPAGDYVVLRICDNGPGIPQAHRQRIWEPFFSTRFLGRGLGLPAALGVVAEHGGCLTLTGQGPGACFLLVLPRAEVVAETAPPATRRRGSVLVVDDDPLVLSYAVQVLATAGYQVAKAGGGKEALAKVAAEEPALVILDIQMPDMDGRQVFSRLRQNHPQVPVVLSSGYDQRTAAGDLELRPGDGFLAKPYRIQALLEAVAARVAKDDEEDLPPGRAG